MNVLLVLVIILIAIIVVILLAYALSTSYEQTITMSIPFVESYRYLDKLYKINTMEITITGKIKNKKKIVSLEKLKQTIQDVIIEPYQGILIQENELLKLQNIDMKLIPVSKSPTLENLSINIFNKLYPSLKKLGCRLTSVQLVSEDLKIKHSRHTYKSVS